MGKHTGKYTGKQMGKLTVRNDSDPAGAPEGRQACDLLQEALEPRGFEVARLTDPPSTGGPPRIRLLDLGAAPAEIPDPGEDLVIGVRTSGLPEGAIVRWLERLAEVVDADAPIDEVVLRVERALHAAAVLRRLRARLALSREELRGRMVGTSQALRRVRRLIESVAAVEATVRIDGEPGTGRSLAAALIHRHSGRRDFPFVAVDCRSSARATAQLYGRPGSDRPALLEAADGGTLFLRNVDALDPKNQVRLSELLRSGVIPHGSAQGRVVDVRIVVSCSSSIEGAVSRGTFHGELASGLGLFSFALPPLRQRKTDIPQLADHFLSENDPETPRRFCEEAVEMLMMHDWPGNVAELRTVCTLSVQRTREEEIGAAVLRETLLPALGLTDMEPLEQVEKRHILCVLEAFGNNKTRAAKALGISARTLFNRMSQWRKDAEGP